MAAIASVEREGMAASISPFGSTGEMVDLDIDFQGWTLMFLAGAL